jgi:hypothetical protein
MLGIDGETVLVYKRENGRLSSDKKGKNGEEYLDLLNDCQLLRIDSDTWKLYLLQS